MAKVYQPKRHSLRPQSTVDMAELLAAREDVCNVVKTSSGSSREKTVCAVNKVQGSFFVYKSADEVFGVFFFFLMYKLDFLFHQQVLMGVVPDRGGRPSEIEAPPPEMPPWQKRQDGGGGWGGHRGGGRGGGGGRWRGGGWNQGGHGDYGGHGRHRGKRGWYQF